MMLIKNGRVIDPGSGYDGIADLVLDDGSDGRIIKIIKHRDGGSTDGIAEAVYAKGKAGEVPDVTEVIDASGLIVAPGLVDVHVQIGRAHV